MTQNYHCPILRWTLATIFIIPNLSSVLSLGPEDTAIKDIPVNIQLNPAKYLHGRDYIATGTNLTAIAEILDDHYKNVSLVYQWSTKNKTIITDVKASQLKYVFDVPDESNFLKLLVIHNTTDTGSNSRDIVVRNPIKLSEPEGKLFLEHGELLNATFKVTGSGPVTYCYTFCFITDTTQSKDNDKKECKCKPREVVIDNSIQIKHYLHYVGNYTMFVMADNIADHQERQYLVKISDTIHNHKGYYVPIVCSIVAVLILSTGIALHMKFKKTVYTETANFDFIRTFDEYEDWHEEQSLAQRVRYLLFKADQQDDQDNLTNNYSIHYGSFQRI